MSNRLVWCRQGWLPVPYCFCPSESAWRKEMKRLNASEPYPSSDARTVSLENKGKLRIYVTVAPHIDGMDPLGIVGLLVHESVHVWQFTCDHVGDTYPSKETEAYAIQLISSELIAAYSKTRMAP